MTIRFSHPIATLCATLLAGVSLVLVACAGSPHTPLLRAEGEVTKASPPSPLPNRVVVASDGAEEGIGDRDLPEIDLQSLLQQSQQGAGIDGRESFASGFQTRQASPRGLDAERDMIPPAGIMDYPPERPRYARRDLFADPTALPPLSDEVWIIQRFPANTTPPNDDVPGCGALMTSLPEAPTQQVPVPLKHTDVTASITGAISSVEVTQQFVNPFSSKIEAVYVFPLPENAAINDFIMTIGDRRIRGVIREREEAQRIYESARGQGYQASLLTQERPNIFTQSVANIEPGKGIDISIRYFNTLSCPDGEFEFVFPMVVGPRFNPPSSTDGVYAAPQGSTPAPDGTTVTYRRPEKRSGHDISLRVAIDTGGAPLGPITCRSHVVSVQPAGSDEPGRALVTLNATDSIPNKDFVLRYRLAGEGIRSTVAAAGGTGGTGGAGGAQTESGGHFSMMLVPPDDVTSVPRRPLEMVFVLDCSGSMSGEPLAQAKSAVERALRYLQPTDTFQVIQFSNAASTLGPAPLPATPDNIRRGLAYLSSLNSEGGTMMIEGIRAALDFPSDPSRLRFVCFLTDGFIGNEDEILTAIASKLGPTRIFSFGIGSSVNRSLMDSMARIGRGAVSYLAAGDSAADIMDAFVQRIAHAPMTDIRLEFEDLAVNPTELFPARVPDLFAGRPVAISGRFTSAGPAPRIRVTGLVGGQRTSMTIPVQVNRLSTSAVGPAPLAAIWARHKIAALADSAAVSGQAEVAGAIRAVALQHGLMSRYTAFIAVDSSTRTSGSYGTTVQVPVPVPQGTQYTTTVPESPR